MSEKTRKGIGVGRDYETAKLTRGKGAVAAEEGLNVKRPVSKHTGGARPPSPPALSLSNRKGVCATRIDPSITHKGTDRNEQHLHKPRSPGIALSA